jgi:hypothetical protein
VPLAEGLVYAPGAADGVTVVEVARHGDHVAEWVGVAGTATNCAGGRTPWDTWLTCEETEDKAGSKGFTKNHGYVFEVDPYDRKANLDPKPIKALGRYAHEAVVVDPQRGHLYLTEDASGPNGKPGGWVGGPPPAFGWEVPPPPCQTRSRWTPAWSSSTSMRPRRRSPRHAPSSAPPVCAASKAPGLRV